ncbi:MAG TPA: alkaline phosphatase PhoX [Myxococcaceae bacterium]|nr:alkaline phosphatase PhoX [Myxococcaceae bacterium]
MRNSEERARPTRLMLICAAALAFTACDSKDGAQGPAGPQGPPGPQGPAGGSGGGGGKSIQFAPVAAPTNDEDRRLVVASPMAIVNGQAATLTYETEMRSGQTMGSAKFGRILDKQGNVLKNPDDSDLVSPSNDFSSILEVGTHLYEVTHFETTPAMMYLSELSQGADGKLSVTSTKPIDFSSVDGLWTPCAGSITPWNTHLGSEEYPTDARAAEVGTTALQIMGNFAGNLTMLRYWGVDPATATADDVRAVFNPYRYGFPVEVTVDEAGNATVAKHYAAGRRALELAYVMPDRKTVYLTDDGTNDGFFLFVAKREGDLSEGQLYAARWFQTSPAGQGGARADIFWIPLGPSATDAQVKALIDGHIKFSEIFDWAAMDADGTCTTAGAGFQPINTDSGGQECLKLKAGQELAASRLESRRYAAYVGATTEFRKNEGITYNPEGHRLYVAYSELNNGTNDNHASRDKGGPNHVKLAENPCGAVMEFVIGPDAAIGSDYVATSVSALLEGTWLANPASPNPYPADSPYAGKNTCAVSNISNPDNVSYLSGYDTLLIGEDSGVEHQNDAVWAYNIVTRELTRILTTPYGAESTGVYWYPNINGHAYIKAQVQHPYGESDTDKVDADPATAAEQRQSYTGYIGPLPSLN